MPIALRRSLRLPHGRHGTRHRAVARLDERHTLLAAPRYDAFRDQLFAPARSRASLRLDEIAGNDDIPLTGVAPVRWQTADTRVRTLHALPLPADSTRKRVAVRLSVRDLLDVLAGPDVGPSRLAVDHVYDYQDASASLGLARGQPDEHLPPTVRRCR